MEAIYKTSNKFEIRNFILDCKIMSEFLTLLTKLLKQPRSQGFLSLIGAALILAVR